MPRTRVTHAVEALFVGPSPATGFHYIDMSTFGGLGFLDNLTSNTPTVFGNGNTGVNLIQQLTRVQNVDFSFDIPRNPVYQLGEQGHLDLINLDPPTVGLNFSYLLAGDFTNEQKLGFWVQAPGGLGFGQGALQGFINGNHQEKNYFLKTTPVSVGDVNDSSATTPYSGESWAFGNMFVNSYQAEGSIGDFPRVNISCEGINVKFDRLTSWDKPQPTVDTGDAYIPALNPVDGSGISTIRYSLPKAYSNPTGVTTLYSVLRPGDIKLNLSAVQNEGGASISDAKIQSYSLNIPMSRTALQQLGTRYPYVRELNIPVDNATFSVTALVGDLTTGSLSEIIRNNNRYNLSVNFNQPNSNTRVCGYFLTGAYLNGQSYSTSIGSNKTVTMNFSLNIGQEGNILFSGSRNQGLG